MLIQVQFIKRELLIATTAIGQLARENELNLRMMATVPAFLLAWGSFRAGGASALIILVPGTPCCWLFSLRSCCLFVGVVFRTAERQDYRLVTA